MGQIILKTLQNTSSFLKTKVFKIIFFKLYATKPKSLSKAKSVSSIVKLVPRALPQPFLVWTKKPS